MCVMPNFRVKTRLGRCLPCDTVYLSATSQVAYICANFDPFNEEVRLIARKSKWVPISRTVYKETLLEKEVSNG